MPSFATFRYWLASGPIAAAGAAILLPQLAPAFFPARWQWGWCLAAVLAAFPFVGWLAGLLSGWCFGYWQP